MPYTVLARDDLRHDGESESREFEGLLFGQADVSFIMVDVAPGEGPRLHRHPYAEVFIVQEGQATFTVGADTIVAEAGQIVIGPANEPHKFVNTGSGRLRQLDIHASGRFITEWLED